MAIMKNLLCRKYLRIRVKSMSGEAKKEYPAFGMNELPDTL